MNRFDIMIFHPTAGWGGAERTTCNIAKAFSGSPLDVALLSNELRFTKHLEQSIHVNFAPFRPWFEKWDNILKDLIKFISIARQLKPRIVIAMMPYAAFLASMARRLMPYSFIHVASPRGSCLSYLKHFVRSRKDKIRYRIFF